MMVFEILFWVEISFWLQEYRKYLEKSGVIDSLTKVLVGLYEEPDRPVNAVDYVKRSINASASDDGSKDALRKENEKLKAKVQELEKTIARMKKEQQQNGANK